MTAGAAELGESRLAARSSTLGFAARANAVDLSLTHLLSLGHISIIHAGENGNTPGTPPSSNPFTHISRTGATNDGGLEKTSHGDNQIIPLLQKRETTNLTRWPENAGAASEEQNLIPIANARSIRDKKENQSH